MAFMASQQTVFNFATRRFREAPEIEFAVT